MKHCVSALALLGVCLFSLGCGNKTGPQPTSTTTKLPTTLNEFDAYMVGNWNFLGGALTIKNSGKQNGTFKSTSYSYIYVLNKDHTFNATVTISGPLGTNVIMAAGKWATSITAGSKPAGSFAYSPGPSTGTKPNLPFSFIITPSGPASDGTPTAPETCYVLYMDSSDNSIAFDWIASSGSAETWERWQKIK